MFFCTIFVVLIFLHCQKLWKLACISYPFLHFQGVEENLKKKKAQQSYSYSSLRKHKLNMQIPYAKMFHAEEP